MEHGWIMTFPPYWEWNGIIIPTDELTPSFFRGVGLNHQAPGSAWIPGMILLLIPLPGLVNIRKAIENGPVEKSK